MTPQPTPADGASVLIVEDNAHVTSALRTLFAAADYRVSVAQTGAAAAALCDAEPPDLMLLDLTLPDGDGLAVLGALRERHRAPRVTVALTGHDDDATRARCLDAGCRAVLVKPVPARDLLRLAAEWTVGAR